jgi:coenzyme F420-0:L-glutamate ligase/coenzyme F420-1:gamma-L-glutamate ligase
MHETILTGQEHAFVAAARRAVLATLRPDGEPRLMPVCFVLADEPDDLGRPLIYSPIDEKPKQSADPRRLGRVQDLLVLPSVTLLVDRWSEDWTRLGWIRLSGRGQLLEPGPREGAEHRDAVVALRTKYAQYEGHALEARPIIRMSIDRVQRWGDVAPDETPDLAPEVVPNLAPDGAAQAQGPAGTAGAPRAAGAESPTA